MSPDEEAVRRLGSTATNDARRAAEDTAQAFEAAGERIAEALAGAARSGTLSFNNLAESVAQDLARLAINELLISPLQNALGGLGNSGSPFAGAGRSTTVNMNLSGVSDAGSFKRSQGQISASLARAVRDGQRFI